MSDNIRDDLTPSSGPATSQPAHTSLEVLQRTASGISPWVRRWWVGNNNTASTGTSAGRAARVPGQFPLALRIQRSLAMATQADGSDGLTDRFSNSIVQRHRASESIGRRYRTEPRQMAMPAPTQLPLPRVATVNRVQRSVSSSPSGEMS